ncbi:type II secretion system F family protein [Puniceicoccus vermicola]|uniref:General secretion pathway protein F n=1 Tax=Puniceicoccus vermicola TaxID=388746 RepID=A0A7X1E3V7_9BACT|nr:type II secretion system F family protein [Puniceicoccus vermicola]MBC2601476.1 type II secretion system F family protein [Puniceicoccus vermicola]
MATLSSTSAKSKPSFWENQRLAKQKSIEKKARKKKIPLGDVAMFTEQLSSMLEAGLPLVTAMEALYEQTENAYFKVVIREVRSDVSGGTAFSEACSKFPNAFPNLFRSMAEAGEASGNLAEILSKTATYFDDTVRLQKKVKSAMTYPVAVILIAIALVNVLLIFVIPVFAGMFDSFGKELPLLTRMLISASDFLKSWIFAILIGLVIAFIALKKFIKTPRGRRFRDVLVSKVPIMGSLSRKIALSRFCRTYSILMRSGVPILQSLDITSSASDNTFIESSITRIQKAVSEGAQISDILAGDPYFPSMVKHMAKAGEETGNVDGMLMKVSDFYDVEIENTVGSLTDLMEPLIIVFLGGIIGTIVMAMFLPIFNMAGVVGGLD